MTDLPTRWTPWIVLLLTLAITNHATADAARRWLHGEKAKRILEKGDRWQLSAKELATVE